MFPEHFCVTEIRRVIYISPQEYPQKRSSFSSPAACNELIYQLDGNTTVRFNGRTLIQTPGMVRFLPEGPVWEYTVEREDPAVCGCIDIFFQTDTPLAEQSFMAQTRDNKELGALFRRIFSLWNGKGDRYYIRTMALLYQILDETEKSVYLGRRTIERIEPAVQYISAHYTDEKIPISYLAELCGISESYLHRIFLQRTRMSPKQYILHLKMERAAELIGSGLFTVSRVAELVGCENLCYFSQAFKNAVGVSPSVYRKKCLSSK